MKTHDMANAFEYNLINFPFFIKCYKKDDGFYYKVSHPFLHDLKQDKIFVSSKDIANAEISLKFAGDIEKEDKYFIYLECLIDQEIFSIISSKILSSQEILPFIDGVDTAKGFKQTYARYLLGIIGYNGRVAQNVFTIIKTNLCLINGSPAIRLTTDDFYDTGPFPPDLFL